MKILCVGKNYAKHAAEMGDGAPEEPIWFWKPESSIIQDGESIRIPPGIGEVHHEVEWAVRIGGDCKPDAMTVALDMTARDVQAAAKQAGRPWAQAKGYDTFLPLGPWIPFDEGPHNLELRIDGDVRQRGCTKDMTWNLEALLAHAATWTTLHEGDVLLTGTPEGVGPVEPGETLVASVGELSATFRVATR
ncbi:MAG: fumarylacetoacetate hydrolase family protein [Thermoplasmatota archaeon]